MHILSLYKSITNKTNIVSKLHFEIDIINFFKEHVTRLRLQPLKVKVHVYEYHRKIAPIMRQKICKSTLTSHYANSNIYNSSKCTGFSYFMLTITEKHYISTHFIQQSSVTVNLKHVLFSVY